MVCNGFETVVPDSVGPHYNNYHCILKARVIKPKLICLVKCKKSFMRRDTRHTHPPPAPPQMSPWHHLNPTMMGQNTVIAATKQIITLDMNSFFKKNPKYSTLWTIATEL